MEQYTDQDLAQKALHIRRLIVRMIHKSQSGHPGGALGMTDIFTALYFDILNQDPNRPDWEERDRLLLSNGHISAVRYAAMAARGYFPEEELLEFRSLGSRMQGHPSTRYLPSVENSSGSLGQGLSQAVGLALGARYQNRKYRVFVGISDGEMGEGMSWEAMQAAAHHRAPVLAFMDLNGIQIDGFTKDVCDLGDLGEKFRSFGWKTYEADGHDMGAIRASFRTAMEEQDREPGPAVILFRTVLGKGVSFMENNPGWHGKAPDDAQMKQALEELQ